MTSTSEVLARCACGRPVHVRKTGECLRCYHRAYYRRHRAPTKQRARTPASDRFWAKVDPAAPDACWLWRAGQTNGYGWFDDMLAHRFAWEERHGPIPDGLTLDHECQIATCVNPAHLNPVPARVNTLLDHQRRGVGRYQRRCVRGHELTPANTLVRQRADGLRRDCIVCVKIRRAAETERVTCPDCGAVRARSSMRRHSRRHRDQTSGR